MNRNFMKFIFLLLLISNITLAKNTTNLDLEEQCVKNLCRIDEVAVDTTQGIENYTHITLEKNCRIETDEYNCDYEYYLKSPDGSAAKINSYLARDIRHTTNNPSINLALERHFIENIYNCQKIKNSSWEFIYEKKIKRENESICVIYKMKPPFTGEIKNCGEHILDTVDYGPNMVTMENAAIKACQIVQQPEGKQCDVKSFGVYTNKKSTYYEILIAKDITPTPNPYPCIKNSTGCSQKIDNEYPVFEMDAMTGEISFKRSLNSLQRYDEW